MIWTETHRKDARMKYLLSMDGGGTKTAWLLTTAQGEPAASFQCGGCSHTQLGISGVLSLIRFGIDRLLLLAGCSTEDILAAAFGIPCYGEYPQADREIAAGLTGLLPGSSVGIYNDVELGFAGSLCLSCGIHLVAGTGAIAIGQNAAGQTARSNGWHPAFSDEGSGYWLGMQALSLFARQADGRAPRDALYSLLKSRLSLDKDSDIISYYDRQLAGNRRKTAALQLLLREAALAGDPGAKEAFASAAQELYLSLLGVYRALFPAGDQIRISYSGGLFTEGSLILPALTPLTARLPAQLIPPLLPPDYGGILLAMQQISKKEAEELAARLQSTAPTTIPDCSGTYHKEDFNGSH